MKSLKLFSNIMKQIDSTNTREYGGTGLGLSICHSLVNLMNGDITVKSAVGAGSTFTVTLEVGKAVIEPVGISDNSKCQRQLSEARALIVEDNLINQTILRRILEKYGMTIVIAENGAKALEIYMTQSDPFDIIFMVSF